jgi:hypothetical protein
MVGTIRQHPLKGFCGLSVEVRKAQLDLDLYAGVRAPPQRRRLATVLVQRAPVEARPAGWVLRVDFEQRRAFDRRDPDHGPDLSGALASGRYRFPISAASEHW